MDVTTIVMISAIVFANIGTMIGLFMWATTHAATATENHRRDTSRHHQETKDLLKAIADEMRDFHGRLCAIEERNSTRLMK